MVAPLLESANSKHSKEVQCQRLLRASAYCPLRSVRCEFADGVLVLRGTVNSYFLKQLAQEAIRNVDGLDRISNEIKVTRKGDSDRS